MEDIKSHREMQMSASDNTRHTLQVEEYIHYFNVYII